MADVALLEQVFLANCSSKRTREAYATDLHQWIRWLAGQGVELLDAQRGHVLVWKSELEERLAPGTVARKLSAISSFYGSAIADGALAANPCAHVRRPKVSQDSTRAGLDKDEWLRLLAAATKAGPVEHVLVRLLGMNGLRVSEACSLRACDLRQERGHDVAAVTRKGGKRANIPLAPATAAAVHQLLELRGLAPDSACSLLPFDRYKAKDVVVRLTAAAGIEGKRITPHSLRHTFVTLSLEAGVPLHDVQDAAGHADPRTTQRYNRARNQLDHHATYVLTDYLSA